MKEIDVFIMKHRDCIVIGGGIVGMCTARDLALRGLTVGLFDKNKLGQEASWSAGGILSSMRPWLEEPYSSALSEQGKALYADFASELKQYTGIDPEYRPCGLVLNNENDIHPGKIWFNKHRIKFCEDHEYLSQKLHICPAAIVIPTIAQIRVPKLLKALHASLIQLGVDIFENAPISKFKSDKRHCKFVQVKNEKYYADVFVITAGAWSQRLLSAQDDTIKIKPVLGQMLCIKFPEKPFDPIILDGRHYLIPRQDGHVLIGSTLEDVGFNKRITKKAYKQLTQWACKLWPDIVQAKFIQQWCGLRPATNHGQPYLGKLENRRNIYINAGHFRKGILQAPVCAEKIADMICSEKQ